MRADTSIVGTEGGAQRSANAGQISSIYRDQWGVYQYSLAAEQHGLDYLLIFEAYIETLHSSLSRDEYARTLETFRTAAGRVLDDLSKTVAERFQIPLQGAKDWDTRHNPDGIQAVLVFRSSIPLRLGFDQLARKSRLPGKARYFPLTK